jgi:microcystin degradation protein MlrC
VKVLIGGILHESNSFVESFTTVRDYGVRELLFGHEVLDWGENTRTVLGGCIDAAKEMNLELLPTMYAFAQPGGPLGSETFHFLLDQFLARVQRALPVDGVLLTLHGAMIAEGIDDAEGFLLNKLRKAVGPRMPIVATLDFHANVSEGMLGPGTAFVGYDTYPHVDMWERGHEAVRILHSTILGNIRPAVAFRQVPLLSSLPSLNTFRHPMSDVMSEARRVENEPGVICVTVSGGFPYSDVRDAGVSVQVVTDSEPTIAKARAKELAGFIWDLRMDFLSQFVPAAQAVREAMSSTAGPVVLADLGDNTGGGAPGDGTALLRELLEQAATNAVVAVMHDPETIEIATTAGIGSDVNVSLGGKRNRLQGPPLRASARVKTLSDGHYVHTGPLSTGTSGHMGRAAVLEIGGVEVVVAELRRAPNDPAVLRSVGIEPHKKQIIVLKSSVHYRAAYEPFAARIIEVDTAGLTSDLTHLPFSRVRRPIFPLDILDDGSTL